MSPIRRTFLMNTIPLAVVASALVSWRLIELMFFPVISGFVVSEVNQVGQAVIIKGTMTKARNCTYEYTQAASIFDGGDTADKARLPIKFLEDNIDDKRSRPLGRQDWGPWVITIPVSPRTVAIELTSSHSCHWLWSQKTHLADIPLLYTKDSL